MNKMSIVVVPNQELVVISCATVSRPLLVDEVVASVNWVEIMLMIDRRAASLKDYLFNVYLFLFCFTAYRRL